MSIGELHKIVEQYRTASANAGTPVTDTDAQRFSQRMSKLGKRINESNLIYKPVGYLPYHHLLDLIEGEREQVELAPATTDFPGLSVFAIDPREVVVAMLDELVDMAAASDDGQLSHERLCQFALDSLNQLYPEHCAELVSRSAAKH